MRQPAVYGSDTLEELESQCRRRARALGVELVCRQSNREGQLIDWVHGAVGQHEGIVINPGAYSHTSIALMDGILGVGLPCIEVHLSNIHRREAFRHQSYISRVAEAVICGLGQQGYLLALDAMASLLNSDEET